MKRRAAALRGAVGHFPAGKSIVASHRASLTPSPIFSFSPAPRPTNKRNWTQLSAERLSRPGSLDCCRQVIFDQYSLSFRTTVIQK